LSLGHAGALAAVAAPAFAPAVAALSFSHAGALAAVAAPAFAPAVAALSFSHAGALAAFDAGPIPAPGPVAAALAVLRLRLLRRGLARLVSSAMALCAPLFAAVLFGPAAVPVAAPMILCGCSARPADGRDGAQRGDEPLVHCCQLHAFDSVPCKRGTVDVCV
jgi:hypothetical protein